MKKIIGAYLIINSLILLSGYKATILQGENRQLAYVVENYNGVSESFSMPLKYFHAFNLLAKAQYALIIFMLAITIYSFFKIYKNKRSKIS